MRVESDKPMRNGGWLHKPFEFVAPYVPVKKAIEDPPLDAEGLWQGWHRRTNAGRMEEFARSLGVSPESLTALGCAWGERAWAFPMKDGQGKVIGIRLRNEAGQKWAVKGSHQGLFVPEGASDKTLWITEGPTDCAAALTLGLYAIGRPSCLGQESMVLEFIRNQRVNRVVVVTDNDAPGLRGAAKLQNELGVPNCLWSPPAKDLRAFVNLGGTRAIVEASVKDIVWTRPNARAA